MNPGKPFIGRAGFFDRFWFDIISSGGESPPFDPDSIPNLFEDWNPALGVTLATGVSEWIGQKEGLVFTQGTAANQPAFLATDVGGKPAIQFDGTNDYLQRVGTITGLENRLGLTVYQVSNSGSWAYQSDNEILQRGIHFTQGPTSFLGRMANGGVDRRGSIARSDSGYSIKEYWFSGIETGNENRLEMSIGGILQTLTFSGTIDSVTFSSGNTRYLYLGCIDTGSLVFTAGKFGRIIIYNRALTPEERALVINGLTQDYLFFLNSFPYYFPFNL